MKAPANPADEEYRLQALHGLKLLDTVSEPDFDAVVGIGRDLLSVPICLVTLIDAERQWFKARSGLDVPETSRQVSFCGHAILGDDIFVVLDATKDARFHDNPLVTGKPFIRFYAGAPIRLPSGYTIGTVCVISPEPRSEFGSADREKLMRLAELARGVIAVRGLRAALDETRLNADRLSAVIELLTVPVALTDDQGIVTTCNEAFATLQGVNVEGRPAADVLPEFAGLSNRAAGGDRDVTCQIRGTALTILRFGAGYAIVGLAAS